MTDAQQYMFEYLIEEFHRFPKIRVRVVPHADDAGVTVRTESREYFFPFEWAERNAFSEVDRLVRRIKDLVT